jgi:hypothetical protein
MTKEEFEQVFKDELQLVTKVLIKKRNEYTPEASTSDCLKNFKNGSSMIGSPELCLCSYMLKHLVSIFDMSKDPDNYEMPVWTEKITDCINYLFLLKALLVERNNKGTLKQSANSQLSIDDQAKKSK